MKNRSIGLSLDSWGEILHTLRKNKLRTIITGFGVFWGIFMLVFMLGAGNGLKNAVLKRFGGLVVNSAFLWSQPTTISYGGFNKGRWWILELKDIEYLLNNVPGIKSISPMVYGGGRLDTAIPVITTRKEKEGIYCVYGVYPEINTMDPVLLTKGRFINHRDIKHKRNVIVIGKRVVQELFNSDEEVIGQQILVGENYYTVVGQFESRHTQEWARFQNRLIYMPLTTVQRKYNYSDFISFLGIVAKDGHYATDVVNDCKLRLAERHRFSPNDFSAFGVDNFDLQFRKVSNIFKSIDILLWVVGIGTLLAGVIGVVNIMIIVLKERTLEIGIRRAIGAQPGSIVRQILLETLILISITGYLGILFGVFVLTTLNELVTNSSLDIQMFDSPDIRYPTILLTFVVVLFSGLLAGIVPARKAIRIRPIVALQNK